MIRFRCQAQIDITPAWWRVSLTWGTPIEQWLQKARAVVNNLDVYARDADRARVVSLFSELSTSIRGVTVRLIVPEGMTDEDIEASRLAIVARLNGNPPFGVEALAA